jgi:hypothetical protein
MGFALFARLSSRTASHHKLHSRAIRFAAATAETKDRRNGVGRYGQPETETPLYGLLWGSTPGYAGSERDDRHGHERPRLPPGGFLIPLLVVAMTLWAAVLIWLVG